MSRVLDEFLALRRAYEGQPELEDRLTPEYTARRIEASNTRRPEVPGTGSVVDSPTATNAAGNYAKSSTTPAGEVQEAQLSAYFVILLAAHPAATPVKNRQALANYLSRGILHKYGNPEEVPWWSGNPVRYRNRKSVPWQAQCPKGHRTDEALETNQVVGWICEQCEKVYDARECRLLPRGIGEDR